MIGQILDGKYEVLRLIGEGGMGAVYEAKSRDDGKRCAVKVINDEAVAKDEVLIQRFEREAYAAKKVLSPNIVEILAAGHDDATGHPYMVMEMLDGENALQVLKRIGPMPPQLALRVGIQTCEGLAKAHEAGVVHRDIKPANLFIADLGGDNHIVKLLDFGVAKFKMDQASESDNESLTRTGSMLGSPMYMSPEQARGLKSIDHRADLWSLGIVMHQLLTGRVPYQDIDGLGELIITICSEPPPLVSETAPWVSREISEVIAGTLKLSTSERYENAREFGDALRRCLKGDEQIVTSMFQRLTDEQKQAVPAAEPSAPSQVSAPGQPSNLSGKDAAAVAAAHGGFVAHDATVALEDVEAMLEEARAARDARTDDEPPPTQALPGPAPVDNLAATVAFPIDGFELPSAEVAPAAPATASPFVSAKPPSSGATRQRDERALAKHRDAQRAAIDAARLGPAEAPSGSGRMVLAIVAGVLLGVGLLGAYWYKVKGNGAAPTASTQAPPAPEPVPTPSPTPSPAPAESAAPAPSVSSAATGTSQVQILPAYAAVQVDNKAATLKDGYLELEGGPGSTHHVRVAANGQSKVVTVTLTDKGPVPNVIQAPTAPAPAPGPKAPKP